MRVRPLVPFLPLVLASIALVACTGGGATTSTPNDATPPPGGVDPLVPYSPPTTPFAERLTGFIPDTLTLPTGDGGRLHVTPVTTTLHTMWVGDTRAFAVYLTVANPGESEWAGRVGADAEIADEDGRVFPAERPRPGDLHPDPGRYDVDARNLLAPVRIPPGESVRGALVFHPTEGNRPIVLRISLDGGTTWGEWTTNIGVF